MGNTSLSIASDCFCTGQSSKSSQTKTAWQVWSSREPPDRSNKDSALGMGLLRSSSPILSLAVAFTLRFSLWLLLFGFQGYWKAGEGEMDIRQVKMPPSSLFLPRFSYFPWSNASCNSLWLISRVPNKLIWIIFARVLIAFMEMIFRGPDSAIFADDGQHVAL